jgi:hypothetical protein
MELRGHEKRIDKFTFLLLTKDFAVIAVYKGLNRKIKNPFDISMSTDHFLYLTFQNVFEYYINQRNNSK